MKSSKKSQERIDRSCGVSHSCRPDAGGWGLEAGGGTASSSKILPEYLLMVMRDGNADVHGEGKDALNQCAFGFRGGAEVGRAVFPSHLEGRWHDVVVLGVALAHRELVDKVPFLAFFNNHPPETIREINVMPVDLQLTISIKHEVHDAVHGCAKGKNASLIVCGFGGLVDRVLCVRSFSCDAGGPR